MRVSPNILVKCLTFYQGYNDAACDDATYAGPRHYIGKRVAQRKPDEYRKNDIGITKD